MMSRLVLTLSIVCGCIASLAYCVPAQAADPVTVTNYKAQETIRYPLVLLRGDLADKDLKAVTVINESSKLDSRQMDGVANKGRYKAFAELVPGQNKLVIKAGSAQTEFSLTYKPQTNPYKLRAIYFTDKAGDTAYETPFKDDTQDYAAKYDAALKVMQSFMADWLNERGYGRRTFNLELDEKGKVIVHIVKGKGSFEEMSKMNGGDAYEAAAEAIHEQLPEGPYKNLVCVAFSRHIKGSGTATAYGALGGGGVATMGGACFYTWPTGVKNITKTFTSDVQIDTKNYHADGGDAVYRTAANTIGAALHEAGHAFELPHTNPNVDGLFSDIMFFGFSQFNRYVTFFDGPHPGNGMKWVEFDEAAEKKSTNLSPVSCAALAPTRYLALDARDYPKENTIRFALDPKTEEVVVRSDAGLEFVTVEIPGAAEEWVKRVPGTPAPKEVRKSLKEIARKFGTSTLTVRVVDAMGNYRHSMLHEMLGQELNLTTGKPVKSSRTTPGASPEDAVDGNPGTFWDAPFGQWLQVDLQKVTTLDEIHLLTYSDGSRYYQYVIEVSTDGKTWTKIADESKNAKVATDAGYRHTFKPTQARFVKVTMLKNSANPGVHISEVRVFAPGEKRENQPYKQLKELFPAPKK